MSRLDITKVAVATFVAAGAFGFTAVPASAADNPPPGSCSQNANGVPITPINVPVIGCFPTGK
jgi:hypothetical protein